MGKTVNARFVGGTVSSGFGVSGEVTPASEMFTFFYSV